MTFDLLRPSPPHQELITQAGLDPMLDESHQERRRQYAQVSLQGELLDRGWCRLVPQLLESSEHDYREKVMEGEIGRRLMFDREKFINNLTVLKIQYTIYNIQDTIYFLSFF